MNVQLSDSVSRIPSLDPSRDYGERTYEQVVDGVRAGTLVLLEGRAELPRIVDAETMRAVKGSAQPPLPGGKSPRDWGIARFQEWASEHHDQALEFLLKGMDPDKNKNAHHYLKLYFEHYHGKPGESRSQVMDAVVSRLLEAAGYSSNSSVTAEDVTDGEFSESPWTT